MSKKFKQFVTDKDKDKAPVKKIADYEGPFKNTPPSGGEPYAATGKGGKATKNAKVNGDWTDKGNKDLVYKPKTDQDSPDKKGDVKGVESVKEFVDETKGLSATEFAKYLAKNNKNSGIVHESIHQTCQALVQNPNNIPDLVRELKRTGLLGQTALECLSHQEGYEALATLMGDENLGESVCRRLVKTMDEMVGPPMHHGMHPRGTPAHHGMLNMGDGGMMGDPSGTPMNPVGGPGMAGPSHPGMNYPDMDDEDDNDDFDDEHLHHGVHDFDDNDDIGLDDEDEDGMGDPTQGAANPGNGPLGTGHRKHMNAMSGMSMPRPSMMARMMSKENHSPATKNFQKALRG